MNNAVGIAAAILLIANGGTFLFARIKSRGVYDEFVEPLDSKEFKTKSMLGVGLFLRDHISLTQWLPASLREQLQRYTNRVNAEITELYGVQEREYYVCIQTANNWIAALLAGLFLALFSLISCTNGDTKSALLFCIASPLGMAGMPLLLNHE